MNNKAFKENYHGILTHDGWIRVAKFNITAKILNIQGNGKIQVRGNTGKGSFICDVHKKLRKDIKFMDENDLAGIKWNMGRPYIVGFKKSTAQDITPAPTGDMAVSENMDWMNFFKKMGME